MAKFFVNTMNNQNIPNTDHERALNVFAYINQYLNTYKKYPSKNFLAIQFKTSAKDITYLLEYLCGIEKLAKEKNSYYIPGKKTLSDLNRQIKEKAEIIQSMENKKGIEIKTDIDKIAPVIDSLPRVDVIPTPPTLDSIPEHSAPPFTQTVPLPAERRQSLFKKCMHYLSAMRTLKIKLDEFFFIKTILLIMFITSIIIEMNYNIDNFITIMGPFKGFLTGVSLVLYDSIAISLIIFVFKMTMPFKTIKEIILTAFIKLFVSLLLFILFSGVFYTLQINIMSGLFEKYQNKILSKDVIQQKTDNTLLNRYIQQEKEINTEYGKKISIKDKIYNELLLIPDTASQEYKTKKYYFTIEERKVNEEKRKLDEIRLKIEKMYSENKGSEAQIKITIFDLLSKNLFKNKISAKALEVNQIFFPALIFNLISSVSLGLLLFLKKNEKTNNN